MCRVMYLGQFTDCNSCIFPCFYMLYHKAGPTSRYLNFFCRPELCPNTCRNITANFILLPENNLPSWHDLCLVYTVSAASKSIQSTLLAGKTIMITQTALSWSTIAILFSSVGDNSSHVPICPKSTSVLSIYVG